MGLDQYLRASRLVLRRPVAQELCEAGAVTVNGAPARASRTVRVRTVPETKQVSRAQAQTLYEVVSDAESSDEW